jgi:CRISPR type III-B/RAMP module-associated protein Cmr5
VTARRIDQGMAAAAASILPPTVTRELRTRYRQLPTMVRTAGLAATYAFLLSKHDDTTLGQAYRAVTKGIREHLSRPGSVLPGVTTDQDVIGALAGLPASSYARASVEAEMLAGWLSRLAEAVFQSGGQLSVPGGGA